jgi:hypothetical protein
MYKAGERRRCAAEAEHACSLPVGMAAGAHQLCCNDSPQLAPHEADAVHVVVGTLNHLLEAEQAWASCKVGCGSTGWA